MKSREIIEKILNSADVKINGNRAWDIKVHDERFYDRVLTKGTMGLGESYMDGWWDCEQIDELIYRILKFSDNTIIYKNLTNILHFLKSKFFNLQTKTRAKTVAIRHYDLGNDLYMSFLDPYNQYTCGYFKDTDNLNTAQENKLELICKKLQLKSTDRVLDIGCGWGGFAKYASEHYGCHVTGISISDEQIKYAKEFTKDLPVEILKMDYRDIVGQYDKVLICGMIEHVGYKNYRKIMEIVKKHLNKNGLFLLHTIGKNKSTAAVDPWIEKYIFPNSILPAVKQLANAYEGLFIMEDWHNFGQYYDPTLMSWYKNFDKSWPNIKQKYDERFYKMFRYYLLACAGAFRARDIQLWQVVLSPSGVPGGYKPIR
ncbi:MAG: cyclopropane fatty acyl phospholipid synthase [Candidatus Paceibacterota bacterium]|jgi:cyclopropane-fatty-acyl-phospholipid synthase